MVGLKTSGEEGGEARRVDLVEPVSDGEIISMMTDGSPPNQFRNTLNAQTPEAHFLLTDSFNCTLPQS